MVVCVLSQQTFPGKLRKGQMQGMSNNGQGMNQTNVTTVNTTVVNSTSFIGGNSTLNNTGMQGMQNSTTGQQGMQNSTNATDTTQVFGTSTTTQTFGKANSSISMSQDPRSLVRKLFSDHSWYHHAFIVASVFKLPTLSAIRTRLLQNAQDLGNGLGTIFPFLQSKSSTITQLLTNHVMAGDNCVKAIISKQNLDAKTQAFYSQGDQVADALSQNLNLPQQKFRTDFHQHNEHVVKLATLLVDRKYGTDYITELDAFNNQMLQLADIIFSAANSHSGSSTVTSSNSSSSLPASTSSYYASTSS
jgi:hypothetical protein